MKSFAIEEKVFKTNPYFVFGCTGEELKKEMNKQGVEIDAPTSYGTQITTKDKKGRNVRILWVEDIPRSIEAVAALTHEIFHLVVRICRDKQVPIISNIETGECGDETAAYLMEFFYEEAMKRLKKKSKAKSKKRR